ncbi:MAG: nucleotidyltransferase family protein [Nitrospirota bacterium]|jgi:hypothetical protein
MTTPLDQLTPVLREPQCLTTLGLAEWDLLIRQARRADLLPRLCILLAEQGALDAVPERPRNHLLAARVVADKHAQQVRWEISRIRRALAPTGLPLLLLKGAAYLAAGLPPARGRLFTDIDLLVPKEGLQAVERILLFHGWVTTHLDAYDQRYYRQWMHELPPLRHMHRHSILDVHHTILPETARLHPDPDKLRAAARPVPGMDGVQVLAPTDMVLHSATHLFHDGELNHGLRDLVDLDDLLRHFGADERFWRHLVRRAEELQLTRPLYYALRYTRSILGTPVPDAVMAAADAGRPPTPANAVMGALLRRALAPEHSTCDDRLTGVARWLLYVRSHYLRMPLCLLVPHLVRKSLKRREALAARPARLVITEK